MNHAAYPYRAATLPPRPEPAVLCVHCLHELHPGRCDETDCRCRGERIVTGPLLLANFWSGLLIVAGLLSLAFPLRTSFLAGLAFAALLIPLAEVGRRRDVRRRIAAGYAAAAVVRAVPTPPPPRAGASCARRS